MERFYIVGGCCKSRCNSKDSVHNKKESSNNNTDKPGDETLESFGTNDGESMNDQTSRAVTNSLHDFDSVYGGDESNSAEGKIPFDPDLNVRESGTIIPTNNKKKGILGALRASVFHPDGMMSIFFKQSLEKAKFFSSIGMSTPSFVKALQEDQRFQINDDGWIDYL